MLFFSMSGCVVKLNDKKLDRSSEKNVVDMNTQIN